MRAIFKTVCILCLRSSAFSIFARNARQLVFRYHFVSSFRGAYQFEKKYTFFHSSSQAPGPGPGQERRMKNFKKDAMGPKKIQKIGFWHVRAIYPSSTQVKFVYLSVTLVHWQVCVRVKQDCPPCFRIGVRTLPGSNGDRDFTIFGR